MREGKAYGMEVGATHAVSLAEMRQKVLAVRKPLVEELKPLTEKLWRSAIDSIKNHHVTLKIFQSHFH
jgi:hypothetical protein